MQLIGIQGVQGKVRLDREEDPLGIVQEVKIWAYWQMVFPQAKIPFIKLLFVIQTDHKIPAVRPGLKLIRKKNYTSSRLFCHSGK